MLGRDQDVKKNTEVLKESSEGGLPQMTVYPWTL